MFCMLRGVREQAERERKLKEKKEAKERDKRDRSEVDDSKEKDKGKIKIELEDETMDDLRRADDNDVLGSEPLVTQSLASTLALLRAKGIRSFISAA